MPSSAKAKLSHINRGIRRIYFANLKGDVRGTVRRYLVGTEPLTTNRWKVLSPSIYLISILPAGSVILLTDPSLHFILLLLLATLGVVFLQHSINLFNDVTDWVRQADVEKLNSWVRYYQGKINVVRYYTVINWILGSAMGILALKLSERWAILWISVPLAGLGFLYNVGKTPLSYTHHSEWVTGLCYGPGVFGCLWWIAEPSLTIETILGALGYGSLAISVLLSHQPPQVLTDSIAGKRSFAVRFGASKAMKFAYAFFSFSLSTLICASLLSSNVSWFTKVLQIALTTVVLIQVRGKTMSPDWILTRSTLILAPSLACEILIRRVIP